MKNLLNYHYEHGRFEVYWGDLLVVELPEAEPNMTKAECKKLANELWEQYLDVNGEMTP